MPQVRAALHRLPPGKPATAAHTSVLGAGECGGRAAARQRDDRTAGSPSAPTSPRRCASSSTLYRSSPNPHRTRTRSPTSAAQTPTPTPTPTPTSPQPLQVESDDGAPWSSTDRRRPPPRPHTLHPPTPTHARTYGRATTRLPPVTAAAATDTTALRRTAREGARDGGPIDGAPTEGASIVPQRPLVAAWCSRTGRAAASGSRRSWRRTTRGACGGYRDGAAGTRAAVRQRAARDQPPRRRGRASSVASGVGDGGARAARADRRRRLLNGPEAVEPRRRRSRPRRARTRARSATRPYPPPLPSTRATTTRRRRTCRYA